MKRILSIIVISILIIIGAYFIVRQIVLNIVYSEDLNKAHFSYQERTLEDTLNYITTRTVYDGGEFKELCTDDRNQALEWSDVSSKKIMSGKNDLIDSRETEKFFEFKRSTGYNHPRFMLDRVHKCSYFKREHKENADNVNLGVFGQRPITKSNVKELTNYLWSLEHLGNENRLFSFVIDRRGSIRHTIYIAYIAPGDMGTSDFITIRKTNYDVDKGSGQVFLSKSMVTPIPFIGKRSGGL